MNVPSSGPVRSDHVTVNHNTLTESEGDEGIVVNLATYDYVQLDHVGLAMWRALGETASVNAAMDHLLREFDVEPDRLRHDLMRFIEQLESVRLVGAGEASTSDTTAPSAVSATDRYLDLMIRELSGVVRRDGRRRLLDESVRRDYHAGDRAQGRDIPVDAPTMIGQTRLSNLRALAERALIDQTPGDLVETGVWRGGATILMRAVLAAHEVADRRVWVCDSFQGLPVPDVTRFPIDEAWGPLSGHLAVSREEVEANFAKYDLLDEQVQFLEGWFRDTLPTAPIQSIAVLRLDGDLYESTIDALTHLYPKVSPGGFVIIDDYVHPSCRRAVIDYRHAHEIESELMVIDWSSVWWQVPPR